MRSRMKCMVWVALLALAAAGCGRGKEVQEYKETWIRLSHVPVKEALAGEPVDIQAEVEVSKDVKRTDLFIHCRTDTSSWGPVKMTPLEHGIYFGSIPAMPRGTRVTYYIQATAGGTLDVRVPGDDKRTFAFYFKGTPTPAVLIAHVALMVLALFIFVICGYLSFKAIRDRKTRLQIPRLAFLGSVVFFISSVPLRMIVEYQTYGRLWSGFPVGGGFTDNKSLAILLYFAAATFLYRGSVFKRDPSRDLIKQASTLPYVYLLGAALAIVLYAIPQ
jgi:hypothetical protein